MNDIRKKAIKYEAEMYGVATNQFVDGFVNGYQQGKADGAREFAELLKKKFNEFIDYDDNGEQTFESNPDLVWSAIDEVLAEWQKGKDNEIK